MLWQYMLIFNVINVKIHILGAGKIVHKQWINKMFKDMMLNSLYVPIVVRFLSRIVQNMEKTLLNLNVNFVVLLLSGFVGVIPIFVNHVIKSNVMETIYQNTLKISSLNVKVQVNVRLEVIMKEMDNKKC